MGIKAVVTGIGRGTEVGEVGSKAAVGGGMVRRAAHTRNRWAQQARTTVIASHSVSPWTIDRSFTRHPEVIGTIYPTELLIRFAYRSKGDMYYFLLDL